MSSRTMKLADDLFDRSSMTFGAHLEELRKAIIRASLWLALGVLVGLTFAKYLVIQITTPLEATIRESYILQAERGFEKSNGVKPPHEVQDLMRQYGVTPEIVLSDPNQPYEHMLPTDEHGESLGLDPWRGMNPGTLRKLRPRVDWRKIPTKLTALNSMEPFIVYLKAALGAGFVIASPGIFWELWRFLAAGLYPHERRYVYWYLPLSLMLFLVGICFAYFVLLRLVLGYLIEYAFALDVEFAPRLSDYVSFVLFFPLGFGIAFQLPIVMLGLNRTGIVQTPMFIEHWRVAILSLALVSMVLTPQDIYTMLGMFLPLTGLYFLGIQLCKHMPGGMSRRQSSDPA